MPSINFDHHTQFFTSTIFEWKHLLKDDAYKQIIIDSLLFLKKEGSIAVNAFVIMPNHIHFTCLPAGRYGKYRTDIKQIRYNCGFKNIQPSK